MCQEGLEEAKELDAFWMELCGSLGVPLNLLKRQQCGQPVEYAGFVFDTWRGLMLIQAEKREKLLASVKGLGEAVQMSSRELDGVKGRARGAALLGERAAYAHSGHRAGASCRAG